MARGNTVEGFREALTELEDMENSLDRRWLKNRMAYYARKHFQPPMRRNVPSDRLAEMIAVTTAKKFAGPFGVRVGVVKNDVSEFPKFSAQALASVLEYGSEERYRKIRKGGLIVDRASTGRVEPAGEGGNWRKSFLRNPWDNNVKPFVKEATEVIEKRVMDKR